ncbi:Chemoreceptor glutamine deamidase CheD [compost metagenome]
MGKLEHHVKIGQIKVAGVGEVLKTVLGSCVGIALIWKRRQKIALAHCLLPQPVSSQEDYAARYVSQTIPKMLEKMGAKGEDVLELEAVVVGGGQMMEVEKPYIKFVVGVENLKMAKQALEKHRIKIVAFEPGGDQGTKIRLDCGTGEYEVEKLPKTA